MGGKIDKEEGGEELFMKTVLAERVLRKRGGRTINSATVPVTVYTYYKYIHNSHGEH